MEKKKIAIVRIYNSNGPDLNVNLVNCRISKTYDEFTFKNEGCLSFPGLSVDTKRYREIVVVDNLVEPHRFVATGLLAVCIQHELDHLEGKLLTDWLPEDQPPSWPEHTLNKELLSSVQDNETAKTVEDILSGIKHL